MRNSIFGSIMLIVAVAGGCKEHSKMVNENIPANVVIGGGCDGCELMFHGIPKKINEIDTNAAWFETGTQLVITGKALNLAHKPVRNVIIYYWQTDNDGYYSKNASEQTQHGHVRGWVRTDENGAYAIYTIRPGPYPNSTMPAHVHFSIKEPDIINEYYIDDLLFDDDKFLTKPERTKLSQRGGNGIYAVKTNNNIQYAERNIILGKNIPNYPTK